MTNSTESDNKSTTETSSPDSPTNPESTQAESKTPTPANEEAQGNTDTADAASEANTDNEPQKPETSEQAADSKSDGEAESSEPEAKAADEASAPEANADEAASEAENKTESADTDTDQADTDEPKDKAEAEEAEEEDDLVDEHGQTPAGAGVMAGAARPRSNLAGQSESMTGSVISQFVIFPAIIVFSIVFAFVFFNWLFSDNSTYPQYMQKISAGWDTKAWQSVYQLQFRLNDQTDKLIKEVDVGLTLEVFENAKTFKDKRIRSSLAVLLTTIGERLDQIELSRELTAGVSEKEIADIQKAQAVKNRNAIIDALIKAMSDPDDNTRLNAIFGLGRLKATEAGPLLIVKLKNHERLDPKTKNSFLKVIAFALGQIGNPDAREPLAEFINYQASVSDRSATDVRWNSALALAQLGDRRGLPTLKAMLNRAHLEQTFNEKKERAQRRVQNVMINAMRGINMLNATETRETLVKISKNDPNLTVRNFALRVLAEFDKAKK